MANLHQIAFGLNPKQEAEIIDFLTQLKIYVPYKSLSVQIKDYLLAQSWAYNNPSGNQFSFKNQQGD